MAIIYSEAILARFKVEQAEAIEDWRRAQARIPSLSDAIRYLVDRGLAAEHVSGQVTVEESTK
ncbi:hypothetical protein [Bradyrhizobium symbiodeficiens]|uniref:hypothetical protein n=1 Tax=Bradyrhizobium symbiodeficiens TaxID=1404367 RepID=UPI000BA1B440|nr:hypothetical protein [Bradyrhizobium symbiodeficiens]AWM07639.1 hypothetical protein CIT39_15075 [Bradyrhizobium symbiodeficiens]